MLAPAVADPEQIIAWDGGGGTVDTTDYTVTRPTWTPDQDIDAIANHRDALFEETVFDGGPPDVLARRCHRGVWNRSGPDARAGAQRGRCSCQTDSPLVAPVK